MTTNMTTTTILSLRDFWNSRDASSIFVAGTACPAGQEYRHDTDSYGDDYCDLTDMIDSLSPHVDLLSLSGTVDGDTWAWDGVGNPRDVRGNSYVRIVVRAKK